MIIIKKCNKLKNITKNVKTSNASVFYVVPLVFLSIYMQKLSTKEWTVYTNTYTHTGMATYTYKHMYPYTPVYTHICMHVSVYIYIYIHSCNIICFV